MNEIITFLLDWCTIYNFYSRIEVRKDIDNSIIVTLRLQRGEYAISNVFFVGDVASKKNWEGHFCDKQLEYFLEKTKREFEKIGEQDE